MSEGIPSTRPAASGPYGGTRVLLAVQPILKTPVLKTGEGKEETVVQASPTEVLVARSCRRFGWETK